MNKLTKLDVQLYDLFDDWNEIDPRHKKLTKEMCIAELQRVAKQLGHTPTQEEFIKHGSMSVRPVEQLFGTWNKALDVAGLKCTKSQNHTKAQVLTELKRVARLLGHTPTQREFNKRGAISTMPVQRLFGTWNKLLKAANLKLNNDPTAVTETKARTELKRVAKRLRHTPTVAEFSKRGSMCPGILLKMFGTWNKALDAVGLKRNHSVDGITKPQVLTELKHIAKQLSHTPTREEFNEHGAMSTMPVDALFGSWNKALDAAGLKRNHNMDGITKAQALAEVKRVAKQLGHTPTKNEFNKHGSLSTMPVQRLFGTWNKALDAAGLKANMIFTRRK